jgi:hypothetical protein
MYIYINIYTFYNIYIQGGKQMAALEAELLEASENGSIPILCDTSPCMARMKDYMKDARLKNAIFEPTEFAAQKLMPHLEIYRKEPRQLSCYLSLSRSRSRSLALSLDRSR